MAVGHANLYCIGNCSERGSALELTFVLKCLGSATALREPLFGKAETSSQGWVLVHS